MDLRFSRRAIKEFQGVPGGVYHIKQALTALLALYSLHIIPTSVHKYISHNDLWSDKHIPGHMSLECYTTPLQHTKY